MTMMQQRQRLIETRYKIISPSRVIDGKIDWVEDPGHDAIAELIKPILCDTIFERVRVFWPDRYSDMLVRDMALPDELVNHFATHVYHHNYFYHHQQQPSNRSHILPFEQSHILGTAVLFDRRVWY